MISKKENSVKVTFIEHLKNDISIDWAFTHLSPRILVVDTLYLLAVSIDKKYRGYLGFEKFLKENKVDLNFTETPLMNFKTTEISK